MNDNAPTKHDPFDGPASPFTHELSLTAFSTDPEDTPIAQYMPITIDKETRKVTIYTDQYAMSYGFPQMEVLDYADGTSAIVPTGRSRDTHEDSPVNLPGYVSLSRVLQVTEDNDETRQYISGHKYDRVADNEGPIFAIHISEKGDVELLSGAQFIGRGLHQMPHRVAPDVDGGHFDFNPPKPKG